MKRLFCILLLLVAQTVHAAPGSGTQADHDQLRQLLKITQQAVNTDTPELLEDHLHPDFVITMMNQELVTRDRTLKQLFHEWFKKPGAILKSLHIEPQATIPTRIYQGRFGFSYGTSVDTYELADGRRFAFDSKWTATMLKEDGIWKMVALHVGVDPIENPLIEAYRAGFGFGGVVIEINRLLFD